MARVSFAQNFEDVVLWRALRDVRWGRYLDIGAQDPIIDSVSQSFYRDGWRGISVEPNPDYAAALRENRPDEEIVEAAVGHGAGPIEFFVVADTGLSTGDTQVAAAQRAKGRMVRRISVPVVPLADLLEQFSGSDLHWLKIDVEGMEAAVLESWGNSTVRPWIVVVESVDPLTGEDNSSSWRNLIERQGYHETLFDGVNRFFVSDERSHLDSLVSAPASSLDDFTVPAHHWCAANGIQLLQGLLGSAEGRAADRDRLHGELESVRADLAIRQAELAERERALQAFANVVAALRDDTARLTTVLVRAERLLAQADMLMAPWHRRLAALFSPAANAEVRRLHGELGAWTRAWAASGPWHIPVQPREVHSMDMFSYDDRNPLLRADSLADLCRFADGDFIACAFVTMLGRQPDPSGHAFYLARLRRGDTKLSILRSLRRSEEGRRHDPGIAGLDRALKRDRAAVRPITGWLVRLLTGAEGDSVVERQLRSLRNAVEAERELAARRGALLAERHDELATAVRQVQTAVRSGTSAVTAARVVQAEGGGEETWEQVLETILGN